MIFFQTVEGACLVIFFICTFETCNLVVTCFGCFLTTTSTFSRILYFGQKKTKTQKEITKATISTCVPSVWGQFFQHLHNDEPRSLWKTQDQGLLLVEVRSVCDSLWPGWLVGWMVGWVFNFFVANIQKHFTWILLEKKNMALKINWKDVERWNFVLIWSPFWGQSIFWWDQIIWWFGNSNSIEIRLLYVIMGTVSILNFGIWYVFFFEAGKQARTWCKNKKGISRYMTHWKSLGFGTKERKSCDFLEMQNSSDMVRPEKTKKKRTPTYDQNF